ncbi:MAG: universal stress protein [Candidatus Levyibacteriota bacterium]
MMLTTGYKKILLTHDGSTLSSAALPHAFLLAHTFGSKIILFRAVESVGQEMAALDPAGMMPPSKAYSDMAVSLVKSLERSAKGQLRKLQEKLVEAGVEVEIEVGHGLPGEEIISAAKVHGADLIIMATRGRSGIRRMMLGSVADYVVRNAPCPVMLIHPQIGIP